MIVSLPSLPNWRHLQLEDVGSTNTVCAEHFLAGDPGQLWVTARRQLAGKARRGRAWVSEPGNLYASVLLVDPAPPEALVGLPVVVSLALHSALLDALPALGSRLAIKWPNDLLLDGEKLSGILMEARFDPASQRSGIIIGCGINCTHFPDNPLYPATSLQASGFDLEPQVLFTHFVRAMAQALEQWHRGDGFLAIRKAWLARAKGMGETITARFDDHSITGRFLDLDERGYLLLKDETGAMRQISAADIFFGNFPPEKA
ncbi:MAG: biotin--[acetyl-CoA-carboxylase] ligase [Pseudomonadota bacterium]